MKSSNARSCDFKRQSRLEYIPLNYIYPHPSYSISHHGVVQLRRTKVVIILRHREIQNRKWRRNTRMRWRFLRMSLIDWLAVDDKRFSRPTY